MAEKQEERYVELFKWVDPNLGSILFAVYEEHHTLYIDSAMQFSTKDIHRYHQSLFGIPALQFSSDRGIKALVLGGGDGLGVKELLKFDNIKQIDLVDISEGMIVLSQKHPVMRKLNNDSLLNKKVNVHVQDSVGFLEENKNTVGETWDIIVLDYPDPVFNGRPGEKVINKLFDVEHFQLVKTAMSDDSVLMMQATTASLTPNVFRKIQLNMEEVFGWSQMFFFSSLAYSSVSLLGTGNSQIDMTEYKGKAPEDYFFDKSNIKGMTCQMNDEKPTLSDDVIKNAYIANLVDYDFHHQPDIRKLDGTPYNKESLLKI